MVHTNRLVSENSPYLLQHAHNPVDWYPWGEEALAKARVEDKPILVSIGYAACHWCHVMERESFENVATAAFMNEHFVNIKIDREERPDLDHIYMDAVQAMTGSGGWPLNVFLTPEAKPFYGGTYFPPKAAFNRVSWVDLLQQINEIFRNNRSEINAQAENLTAHLQKTSFVGKFKAEPPGLADLHTIYHNCMKDADRQDGGFGSAPKFPNTFTIQYLLHYYQLTNTRDALAQACLSLDKMIAGGIYDQIGGGFARYSTDGEWLAPHFEKMLYDNALLIGVLADAYQITKKELYGRTIEHTMSFIQRELLSPETGFYAALDADSEGEEGRFYVWNKEEVEEVLGEEAVLFNTFYDVTEQGNWEGHSILRVKVPVEQFAAENGLAADLLEARLSHSRELLLERRAQRERPLLDDKILLSWNALMNSACSRAYLALGKEEYKQLAIDNMAFILNAFYDKVSGGLYHTYKLGKAKYPAFLEDYASLTQALILLKEITGHWDYLEKASDWMNYTISHFGDPEDKLFYFTNKDQPDVIVRKKDIYDGAIPSANALTGNNLFYLGKLENRPDWKSWAEDMVRVILEAVRTYPTSFGVWADLVLKLTLEEPPEGCLWVDGQLVCQPSKGDTKR